MERGQLTAGPPWPDLSRISAYVLTAVWILELANLLHPAVLLQAVGGAGLVVFVLMALARASRHIRVLFLAVAGSAVLIAIAQRDVAILGEGLRRALIFGAFMPSVLLLRATVEASARTHALRQGIGGLSEAGRVNWTLYGSHTLGAILNVGAMAILAPVVSQDQPDAKRALLAASSSRGVGIAVMWSPFFVAMGFVTHLVPGVQLWQVMLLGAGVAAVGLAVSHVMFTPELGWRAFRDSVARLRPLLLPTAVIVGSVLAATALADVSGPQAVALAVPVLCGAYLALAGWPAMKQAAARTFGSFSRLSDEIIIVTGATLLGVAIAGLPAVSALTPDEVPAFFTGLPLIAGVVALLTLSGLLGLHPMIGASVLVPVLAGGAFGVNDVVLVEAAVFAWGLSAIVAIWTLPVAVASTMFRVPVKVLGAGRNLAFAAIYAAGAIALLGAVNFVLTR
ncbi:MAG TPA: hypothetical protein VLW45_05135 [Pelomicrobium sp.]|nr:hypothetical protein [Pelomicrobium sp.]